MRFTPMLLTVFVAVSVSAHIVPVLPSQCTFDPATLEMPAGAVVVPLAGQQQLAIIYDPAGSTAEFDLGGAAPWQFTVSGVDGTLAFSSPFPATLRASGQMTATPASTFTMGSDTMVVSIPVTTGLAVAGDTLLEGVPIGFDGRFTWVGVVPSPLGPPLAGGPVVVRLSCQAEPVPDTDQFRLGTTSKLVSASLKSSLLKLKLIFAPGTGDEPDFTGRAALLRISTGDAPITTLSLAGLQARGKKTFIGQSDDGRSAIGVRRLRRNGQVAYLLALKVQSPSMPTTSAALPVTVTFDLGSLLSRTAVTMKPKKHGALFKYP